MAILDEAIIQTKEIARLDYPTCRDLEALRKWMRRDYIGEVDLISQDSEIRS
jgi:hypothetical protein